MGWLEWLLEHTYDGSWETVPTRIKSILEVALYQLLYLERIPDYAAVHRAVSEAKNVKGRRWDGMVNYVLREILRERGKIDTLKIDDDPVVSLSVRWSCPLWIVKRWVHHYGRERAESLCRASTERPKIHLRINPLRSTKKAVMRELKAEGLEAVESDVLSDFLILEKGGSVLHSRGFKQGWFSIQDTSAGLVAHLMDPRPGERIIDLTAAPGMKSTHMGELSRDKALIVANDRHSGRLSLLLQNRIRLGLDRIRLIKGDGRMPSIRCADKILVDAPCSGLGVLRRRGDLRWKRKEEDLKDLIHIQNELLAAAANVLRSGGTLVYSTCTMLPEENEDRIIHFLSTHSDFRIEHPGAFVPASVISNEGYIQTWPDVHQMDGSFAVRLTKEA